MVEYNEPGRPGSALSHHSFHHTHTHTPLSTGRTAAHARHGHHHTRSDSHHFTTAHSRAHSLSGKPLSQPSFSAGPRGGYFDDIDEEDKRRKAMSPKNIGRAIGARFVRAVKRGNLPFMLVFTM